MPKTILPIDHPLDTGRWSMDRYRIGIDLSGTKIEAVLLAPDGKEQHRNRIPTPKKIFRPSKHGL